VYGNDGVRRAKVLAVKGESLACKQVNWDRISRKGVKNENVKVLTLAASGFPFKRKPCVSMYHFNRSLGIPQIREKGVASLGESNNIRIDFVKPENIAGPGEDCKIARSQPYQADTHGLSGMVAKQEADTALGAIITDRLSSELGIKILPPVFGQAIAKVEEVMSGVRAANNGKNTVKIP